MANTVFINFRGGIIDPRELRNILFAVKKLKIFYVRFSLRQQLLVDMEDFNLPGFTDQLEQLNIEYGVNTPRHPNLISSFPAEDIFIRDTWLTEGVYKEILNAIDYKPTLKVNICDSDQSFTPMLTGNINWVAASADPQYWHLIIRFPKTNTIYEWSQLCHSSHISTVTKAIEQAIISNAASYIDNTEANGDQLFTGLSLHNAKLKPADKKAELPPFNLPYYEGLNRYGDKYWLGIYRRDEFFNVDFLIAVSQLCIESGLSQLCCTAWKTIMIKWIEEKDKAAWNLLLEKFQINMRHAANELNFQVEDNSVEALELKNFLVKHLSIDDMRTFGICIGIKTRSKSEIFSSILVRRRYMIDFLGIKLFKVYDILNAKNFNPNERTEEVFSSDNFKFVLPEQLRRSVLKYYRYRESLLKKDSANDLYNLLFDDAPERYVWQCTKCKTIYDPAVGEPDDGVMAGTAFEELPSTYVCSVCESAKADFVKVKKSQVIA